jgi:hypothetical protein
MRRVLTAVLCVLPVVAMAAPVLDRDLSHYTILGLRRVRLKNFAMEPPGCHVGVNCGQPDANSPCGQLNAKHAQFGGTGQLVADNVCATESFFEVFKNRPATCGPDCSMIADPGPAPDCTSTFAPPLVGDLDGDGNPSCSAECVTDVDDIAAAYASSCRFPPATSPTRSRRCREWTAAPATSCRGTGRAELAAGTCGASASGTARASRLRPATVACSVKAGKATRSRAPASRR